MLETSHRKQPKSMFFFSKKNQQLKTCSVWILRYYTLKKVTCPLTRGQFQKERIALQPPSFQWQKVVFEKGRTSLEKSHLELRISIFQVGGRYRKNVVIWCYVHPEKLIQDGTREVKLHLGGYTLHWSRFFSNA